MVGEEAGSSIPESVVNQNQKPEAKKPSKVDEVKADLQVGESSRTILESLSSGQPTSQGSETKLEKPPQFIRQFSKEKSKEERSALTKDIRAKRNEHFQREKDLKERQGQVKEQVEQSEAEVSKELAELRGLEEKIAALSGSKGVPAEFEEAREMINAFYESEKKKWENAPYDKEEVKKYFSEDHLKSLSLQEYILLLKRFPSHMVTHVTRQGIRESIFAYHNAGVDQFSNGFVEILKDGQLNSALSAYLSEGLTKEAVVKFLHLDQIDSKEQALRILSRLKQQGGSASYSDRAAVHFAAEEVADRLYGAEHGNEIFFTFPSAYIASQFFFSGSLTEGGSGIHNDIWVWNKDQTGEKILDDKGLDINAGLVFIPAEARVNPQTGSKFELDGMGNPIINQKNLGTVNRIINNPDFGEFATKAGEIESKLWVEYDESRKQQLEADRDGLRIELKKHFGILDPKLQNVILKNAWEFWHWQERANVGENVKPALDQVIEEALKAEGIYLTLTKDAISSKEYWENFFAQSTHLKPSKIVYYKEKDPTTALNNWRRNNGLLKTSEKYDLGFHENATTGSSQEVDAKDRFVSLAKDVVEEYYSDLSTAA